MRNRTPRLLLRQVAVDLAVAAFCVAIYVAVIAAFGAWEGRP